MITSPSQPISKIKHFDRDNSKWSLNQQTKKRLESTIETKLTNEDGIYSQLDHKNSTYDKDSLPLLIDLSTKPINGQEPIGLYECKNSIIQ